MIAALKNYLETQRIQLTHEEKNMLTFSKSDLNFVFFSEDGDPYYFRLLLPNVMDITAANSGYIKDIILDCNMNIKVAKGVIINENVWISVEQFAYSKENINELFERVCKVAKAYYDLFNDSVQKKEQALVGDNNQLINDLK